MISGFLLLFLIAINVLLFSPASVHARQWHFAAEAKNTSYFIDCEDVNASRFNVTFWVKSVAKKTGKVKSIKKCTVNCGDRTVAVREISRYDVFGNLEKTSFEFHLRWYEIPRNSATETIEKIVCTCGTPRQELEEYFSTPYARGIEEKLSHLFSKNR
jgi:hypothetical protein